MDAFHTQGNCPNLNKPKNLPADPQVIKTELNNKILLGNFFLEAWLSYDGNEDGPSKWKGVKQKKIGPITWRKITYAKIFKAFLIQFRMAHWLPNQRPLLSR